MKIPLKIFESYPDWMKANFQTCYIKFLKMQEQYFQDFFELGEENE